MGSGDEGVPDAATIADTVKHLLSDSRFIGDEENAPGGTGRLVVYSDGNGGATIALELGTLSPKEVEAL